MTPAIGARVLVDTDTLERILNDHGVPEGGDSRRYDGETARARRELFTQITLARGRHDRLEESNRRGTLNAKIRLRLPIGLVVAEAWEMRGEGDHELLEAFMRLRDRFNARWRWEGAAVVERCAPYEANAATDVWENVEA